MRLRCFLAVRYVTKWPSDEKLKLRALCGLAGYAREPRVLLISDMVLFLRVTLFFCIGGILILLRPATIIRFHSHYANSSRRTGHLRILPFSSSRFSLFLENSP